MKTLFKFASHELSQDAFLRWLFENKDETEELRNYADSLLRKLLGLKDGNHSIKVVKTTAQEGHIDVLVSLKVDEKDYVLAIEDKINASVKQEDNQKSQIEEYSKYLAEHYEGKIIKKALFKLGFISDKDRKTADEQEYLCFDIHDIHEWLEALPMPVDEILLDYKTHFETIYNLIFGSVSVRNVRSIDDDYKIDAWKGIFERTPTPIGLEKCHWDYHRQYESLVFYLKGDDGMVHSGDLPLVEIKNRDLEEDHLTICVMVFNMEPRPSEESVEPWREALRSIECTNLAKRQTHVVNNLIYKFVIPVPKGSLSEQQFAETIDPFLNKYRLAMSKFVKGDKNV